MDFDLSEEQRMLKESVERLIGERYEFEQRKTYMKEACGFSREMWQQYADMGLLGLPFDEKHGGMGGGAVETMIVMEAFGRGLTLEPYLATVVMGGGAVTLAGSEAQRADILPRIAGGELLLALAYGEPQSRYDLGDVATTARRDADGWILDGTKSFVAHADSADKLIVSARISGDRRSEDGIGLFLVDANAAGVTRRGYPTHDGQRAAEVKLANVKIRSSDALGEPGKGLATLRRIAERTLAATGAEAVGGMAAAHEITVDYLKTRKQFGVTIGSFQALQHRAVDMLVSLEQARSMALLATMMVDEPDALERAKNIAAATVQLRRSARFVGQQAVQLHGGIGMTDAFDAGLFLKLARVLETLYGSAVWHRDRSARVEGY